MRFPTAVAVAAAALALGATPAVAQTANPHRFVGSPDAEPRFSGEGAEFELKPFTVECEKERSKPAGVTPTFPSKTLTADVSYSECEAEGTIGKAEYEFKAKFADPVTINYHADGYVEIGSGGTVKEGKLEGAGPIEIKVSGPFKCTIAIAPGTYPAGALKRPEGEFEAAKYTNLSETVEHGKKSEEVKRLEIENDWTKLKYELEGEYCEALPKTEYTGGIYEGSLVAEIKKGAIGWE